MASIDRVMALAEELKKKKKDPNYEVSPSTINTLDLANELRSGNKDTLKTYMSNYDSGFDAPIGNLNKKDDDKNFLQKIIKGSEAFDDNKNLFKDGYDFGDISRTAGELLKDTAITVGSTAGDIALNIIKAPVSLGSSLGKGIGAGVAQIADWTGNDEYAQKVRNRIAGKEENAFGSIGNPMENAVNEGIKKLDATSISGDTGDAIAQGVGYQLTFAGVGKALGGAGNINVGSLQVPTLAVAAGFGEGMGEAYSKEDVEDWQAWLKGTGSGVISGVTEGLFGMFGVGGSAIDDYLVKTATKTVESAFTKAALKTGIKAVGESTEELLEYTGNYVLNHGIDLLTKITGSNEVQFGQVWNNEEVLEQMFTAAMSTIITSGGGTALNVRNNTNEVIEAQEKALGRSLTDAERTSIKNSVAKDTVTREINEGYSDNEQIIIDAEIQDRVAELEKGGNKLSNKEKEQIKEQVQEDLQKGYISTDTIERTLGGDTYNQLKTIRNNQTNLENQIAELENKANAEITVKEMERLQALREKVKKIDTNTLETQLQSEMGQRIQSDAYLQRSYQEKAKRSKEFTYEAAETDSEFRRGVMDSTKGKLNDTTRSHETAEALVKLSEDRKMQYKFTNNAELKDMGLVQEGKTANGIYVVEKDGKREILVNTDSKKYVEAVLVHETAHDFQNTSPETYTKLVDITREFAEAQNDYSRVYSEVAGMYKNVKDAKIDEEVTSRLLEDYLGNKEFINSLTTKEPSIVKKIIDEIKYLYKKFTAGSPEARKLLELQHELEKTYREAYRQTEVKTDVKEGTKFSLSEETYNTLVNERQIIHVGNVLGILNAGTFNGSVAIQNAGMKPSYYKGYKEGIVFKPVAIEYLNKNKLYKGDGGNNGYVRENPNKYSNIEDFINEDTSKRQITKYNEGIIEKDNQIPINSETVDYILIDSSTSQELIDKAKEMGFDVRYSTQKVQYSLSEDGELVDNKGNEITLETSEAGTHGTLMAIHNLNADKLKGILELGGFPFPSIAITKPSSISHEGYGDISVLFDKNTIDPKTNKKNKVYSRDAYTPRFPSVEYEIDSKVIKKIKGVIGNYDYRNPNPYLSDATNIIDNVEDNVNRRGLEETLNNIKNNSSMKYVYLKSINPTFQELTKAEQYSRTYNNETLQRFLDNYDGKFPLNDIPSSEIDNYVPQMVQAYEEQIRNEYAKYPDLDADTINSVVESQTKGLRERFAQKDNFLTAAYRLQKYGVDNQVLDTDATNELIDKTINKEDYDKWIDGLFEGIISKKGLRNNKDYYTPSGNRRTFDQLHDEYTLDNVVKIMTALDDTGSESSMMTGINEIAGNVSKRLTSIQDIKNNEYMLQSYTDEEYSAILEEYGDKLFNLQQEILDRGHNNSSNQFIAMDNLGSAISEVARDYGNGKKVDVNKVAEKLNEYGFNPTTEESQTILNMFDEFKELPTEYFEAKPKRAVKLNEAQAIVIPNTTDAEFKQQLQEAGLKHYEYDPTIEGDRQRVINQFDDLKFSLSNESDIAPTSTRNQTAAQDIRLQVEEAIAPLQEEIAELREQIAESPVISGNSPVMSGQQQMNTTDIDYAPASQEVVEQQSSEAFNTIEDIDMPSEIEDTTPETEELTPTESLFDTRDYAEVGNQKIKAYQYENPEVRPFFQQAAREMMSDLDASVKGERFIVGDNSQVGNGDYYYSGTTRHTTEDIAELLDGIDGKYKYTYAEIRKGLQAIIEDNGKENNAASKRIEFYLDKRLREGYTDIDGYTYPADEGYLDVLRVKGISDYYSSLPIGEAPIEEVAPVVNASNTESAENIAPVRNSTGYTTIGGQQHLNLNNLGETLQDNNVDWDSVENTALENARQLTIDGTEEDLVKKTKKELRKALLGTEAQKEFIMNALDNAKNRSMAFMNNTDTIRNTELVFGRDAGRMINEVIFQKEIDNEADSIKWQNKERDEIKALGIKARSKESAAVQKYGEKQYVDDAGNVMTYGDTELASEFSDVATQNKIKNAAQVIRSKYDTYIDEANKVLTKLGFDPIKKRNDYMRHFQELNDVFSRWGLPFNAQNMQEHTLPTDINGLTEFWSPQKNYFANMQERKGLKTTYDAITGVDGYIGGIANLIYHTEDIQRGRAFEELIRETYGEDKGFDNLDNLPDDVKQLRAEKIQDNHLSNYAAWVHEWTNNVAGKKNKIDRSVESVFGRKAFSFLDQTRKQVGSNMIGFNLSSSLTNLIAPVQAMAKTNKLAVVKGTADTIKNIFVKDSFMDNNKFLTSRMGTDMISKNAWQKIQDAGFVFMKGMDWFSSNQIVRSKYYELRSKGMSEAQAHAEAGQFAARILGDRTKGANAQLYNSKLVGLVTQFQLEVNNQLYSMFYDTYHESKEAARNNAVKTAAGMTFTLGQLFAFTHLFGKTFEAIAGYNPTFDVIGMLMTAIGWGDDEDEEKTTSERLKAAADQLVDALPYVNILTGGGRIPVASGIPNLVGVATGGKDQYGNELTLEDELKKLLYLVPPTGGNQVKKTTQGLSMFDEDLPVSGSYTDSGNLRFPVEDTPLNRVQAGLFGQWANENAKEYFDKERQPLKEKQIQEYADLDLPIKDYWEYRDGLKDQNTLKDKFEYVNSLDVSTEQKNIMINNIVDRKEAVDMGNYDDFGSYEEFDFAIKNEEKYNFLQSNNISYSEYIASEESKEAYNWAYNNPESYTISKAIADVVTYRKYASDLNDLKADKDENGKSISGSRKEKVIDYINGLDADYGSKLILYKMEYPSDDNSNYEIINYLNEREDITFDDMVTILTKLDMKVYEDGTITWD